MLKWRFPRLFAALLWFASGASAAETVSVTDAWVRALPPVSTVTAAYLTIQNRGGKAVTVTGLSTPAAAKGEIHTHTHDNGVMRMRQVKSLEVLPGKSVAMRPGGLHLMLIQLVTPLKPGQRILITLEFANREPLTIKAEVR